MVKKITITSLAFILILATFTSVASAATASGPVLDDQVPIGTGGGDYTETIYLSNNALFATGATAGGIKDLLKRKSLVRAFKYLGAATAIAGGINMAAGNQGIKVTLHYNYKLYRVSPYSYPTRELVVDTFSLSVY